MHDLYIPTLHTFAMNNPFTGSCGAFRFKIQPNIVKLNAKGVDMENSSIYVEYWHGPFCYEKSEMEGEETFPLTEQGRMEMKDWLENHI